MDKVNKPTADRLQATLDAKEIAHRVVEEECAELQKERDRLRALLGQMQWVMDESQGVMGLTYPGGVTMEWSKVIALYLPGWYAALHPAGKVTP